MRPELRALRLADPPERWESLGFKVGADDCELGGVQLRLGCQGNGITGWTLAGIPGESTDIDGLPTEPADHTTRPASRDHPNGAIGLDHVVVTTPDFGRTAAALEAVGMALRRVIERPDGRRMGFRRLGPAILELAEAEDDGSAAGQATARFWGLVVVVQNLDALADRLGDHLGSIRAAVQPGRRIATLHQSAGLGEAVAFMSPEPPAHSP